MGKIPFEGNPIGAIIGGETPPTPVPIPTSGLVFYTPASGTTDEYAYTGQYLEYSGGTATSKDNVPCVHLNGSNESIVTWHVDELPQGNSPFTMSIWAQMDTNVGDRACEAFAYGYPEYYQAIYLGAGRMYDGLGQAKFGDHLPDIWCENTIEKDEWYHLLQTYDGEYFNCYLNGVLISSEYCTDMNVFRGVLVVGGGGGYFGEYWAGYIAAPRIYDRVLTSGEIYALTHEFTPITVPTFNDQTIVFTNEEGAATKTLRFDLQGKTGTFSILSGTLPNTVTFNPSGSFTYDGTTIAQSATYPLAMQLSGAEILTTSAAVTIEMTDQEEIPTNGLTMWHSLSASLTHPEIGDDFTLTDDAIVLTTNQGIHCGFFGTNYGGLINSTGNYYNDTDTVVTMSVWAKFTGDRSDYWLDTCPFSIGKWNGDAKSFEPTLFGQMNSTLIKICNVDCGTALTGILEGWHNYVVTCSGNNSGANLYIDGNYIGTTAAATFNIDHICGIGGSISDSDYIPRDQPWKGYIAGCRIYNRALTQNEIYRLADEYHPLTDALFGNQEFNFSNSEGASSRSMWFDVENKTPVFTVVSGALPNGVTMDSTSGTFAYDGTTIAQDEDIQVVVELSGNYVSPASGIVTFKMTDQAIVDTNDYFYVETTQNYNQNAVGLVKYASPRINPPYLEWSYDKSTWHQYIFSNENTVYIPVNANSGKIYYRGTNQAFADDDGSYCFRGEHNDYDYCFDLHGNIMSLLDKTCQSTTLYANSFRRLFAGNSCIYHANDLKLPAMTLAENCYYEMFSYCTNLVYAPELPANTLNSMCYYCMFSTCQQLITMPQLSATTLAYGCYANMFENCIRLRIVSDLPAASLTQYCYNTMFRSCTSLTNSPIISASTYNGSYCLASMFFECYSLSSISIPNLTSWSGDDTYDWVYSVAAEGVFNCSPALPKEFGNSRIPVGWKKNPDLLYFQAAADNSAVALNAVGSPTAITLSTSYDGSNWSQYTIGDVIDLQNTGDIVFFKGNNNTFSLDNANYYNFAMSGSIDADGNIMSLLEETGNLLTIPTNYCFRGLFADCSNLYKAPELPASGTTQYCYGRMFYGCSNLTTPPELPAMTVASHCYDGMFYGCSSLTGYSSLPAPVFGNYCYTNMFRDCTSLSSAGSINATSFASFAGNCCENMFCGCTSLTTAPTLKAAGVATYAYSYMFYGCSSLSSISVKFTEWAQGATFNWVGNVAASGIFSCPDVLSAEYGDSRIPTGWSISHDIDPIVTSGLTFFQPFTLSYITPQVGHDMTLSGTAPTLSSVNGVNCVVFDGNQLLYDTNADYWTMPGEGERSLVPDMTVSMWVNVFNFTDGDILDTGGAHGYDEGNGVTIGQNEDGVNNLWCDYQGHYRINYPNAVANQWYHIAWKTYDDAYMAVYVNGQYIGSESRWWPQLNHPFIGLACHQEYETISPRPQNCAIAGFRIYDRTLEDSEIALLATEF